MSSDYVCIEQKCSITGAKTGLSVIRLISPYKLVNATDEEMARMEWAWGMERGGLDYYLSSAPNNIILRDDIAAMYANAEFVLLPTHKTFQDAMVFREQAGYCDRDEEDRFPLRPMTALGRVFRYVFIPITDAAEELARRLPLQRQTDEDWNGGIHPYSGTVMDRYWRQYSVVETHCHPVSICYYARMVIDVATSRGWAINVWPWMSCLTVLEEQWGIGRRSRAPPAPQWFVDCPTREDDDESLPESQQTGYWPLFDSTANSSQRVPGYASSGGTSVSQSSSRVLEWVKDLPQRKACPITGDTSGLGVCHLMEPTTHLVDLSDEEMARMEWAWGLERGGFDYYVGSPANSIFFRRDIADMFANEEFILLPTHKTYKDAMEFSRRIGFCDRAEDDYSPRRPLTALGRSFRYVFIPFSDAAQRIAEEIPMQQQTDEDWNGGVNPVTGEPMEPWVKEFRVVETHSHLVSVCYAARKVLDVSSRRPGLILCPWTLCLYKLEKQWGIGRFVASLKVPEWFINTPENDDESLSGTEATGYWPFLGSDTPSANRVSGYASSGGTNASQSSSHILEWARKVPQRKVPLRWSARLASKGQFDRFK
ncbi:hypothetical protein EV122DRAFT_282913 [Schizophyllum commune]